MGVYDGMFFLVRLNSDWPAHCPRSPTSPARSRRGSWVYAHAPATASTALTTALPTTALQPPPVHPTRHSRMTSIMPACTLGTHSNQTTMIIVVQPADASPARRTDLDNSCRATGETRSRPPRLPTSARASELASALQPQAPEARPRSEPERSSTARPTASESGQPAALQERRSKQQGRPGGARIPPGMLLFCWEVGCQDWVHEPTIIHGPGRKGSDVGGQLGARSGRAGGNWAKLFRLGCLGGRVGQAVRSSTPGAVWPAVSAGRRPRAQRTPAHRCLLAPGQATPQTRHGTDPLVPKAQPSMQRIRTRAQAWHPGRAWCHLQHAHPAPQTEQSRTNLPAHPAGRARDGRGIHSSAANNVALAGLGGPGPVPRAGTGGMSTNRPRIANAARPRRRQAAQAPNTGPAPARQARPTPGRAWLCQPAAAWAAAYAATPA